MRKLTIAAGALAVLFAAGAAVPASAQFLNNNNPLSNFMVGAGAGYGTSKVFGANEGTSRVIGGVVGGVNVLSGIAEQNPSYGNPPPPPPPRYPPQASYGPVAYGDYSYETVWRIQSGLQYLGYSPGPVDGKYGTRTGNAIAQYQRNNGLAVDGIPSQYLYSHMQQYL